MCGIAGVQLKKGVAPAPVLLERLQSALYHRGPDANGQFVAGSTGLVSTRLAIVDIAHGDQPLLANSGVALVANGEIYNAPELRTAHPHYPYKTGSDCEPILALFETFDIAFADHLRGMYAVALYDPASERLVLSRDPFGIKPLYYVENAAGFAFASEIGALTDAGLAARSLDSGAESELLQLKYVTGTKTILPDVKRVEPGETIVIENGAITLRRSLPFWPPNAVAARPAANATPPADALLDRFTAVMRESVAVHLRAEADWCLFYSGGVDSTILMHLAKQVAQRTVRALTIGYAGAEAEDESRDAMRLAQAEGVLCERIE